MAEDARERYIRESNTPGSTVFEQNRWEKAGGRGAYPVLVNPNRYDTPDVPAQNAPFRSEQIYPYLPHAVMKPGWLEAGTKWKQNIPLMLRSLRQRNEFKDWSDDELTHYMHRTFSNRGGLMSLI